MSRSFDRGDVYDLTKEFLIESGEVDEDTTGSALRDELRPARKPFDCIQSVAGAMIAAEQMQIGGTEAKRT